MLHCRVYGQAANAAGMSITSRSRSANRVQIQVEIQNETASDFKCSLAQGCRKSLYSVGRDDKSGPVCFMPRTFQNPYNCEKNRKEYNPLTAAVVKVVCQSQFAFLTPTPSRAILPA